LTIASGRPFLKKLPVASAAVRAAVAAVVTAVTLGFFSLSASGTSLRFVFEALFFVESLLALGKNEFRAAVFACQSFICHDISLLKK
jgi:hypothetical protein